MKVIVTGTHKDLELLDRRAIALKASRIIEGSIGSSVGNRAGIPYISTEGKEYHWTLDTVGEWYMQFAEDNTQTFEVLHRDQFNGNGIVDGLNTINKAVIGLAEFIAYRINGQVTITY